MSYKIIRGDRHRPVFNVLDSAGAQVDMTVGGRALTLRMRLQGAGTLVTVSATYTAQSTGIGYWGFTPAVTAALTLGRYDVDAYYTDTDGDVRTVNIGLWVVEDRNTAT